MRVSIQQPRNLKQSQGYFLLELVIAAGIVAVGLLGVASMQIAALKLGDSAIKRGEAAVRIQEMSSRMRANINGVASGSYQLNTQTVGGAVANTGKAGQDIQNWLASINASHGAQATATINCPSNLVQCSMTIVWQNVRPDGRTPEAPNTVSPNSSNNYQASVIF